ncbi:molecular chaperone [Enterocloster clostridioformis]|uniref:molecular chaperone n=1 Tax=Enterocloster clostridioformis TaxID=1531 RepID=UPI002676F1F0|nr:molecular chaperone [Enterocloster clostridioformis]
MDKYGYVLKRREEKAPDKRYRKAELELMTTFQLKEICRKERIIQGITDPMDKEELVRTVLRFRGADEYFLIDEPDEKGLLALERVIKETRMQERQDLRLQCNSKITAYDGLAIDYYDGLTLPYDRRLAGTNALVVGGDMTLCAVLNVVPMGTGKAVLYLTKADGLPCKESGVKNYSLYCMGRRESELLYRVYSGRYDQIPEYLEVYRVPLLDFEVRKPLPLDMPLAMDFGTSSTTAGVYLDNLYFERVGLRDGECGLRVDDTNYALFYDTSSDWEETTLLPSAVGVQAVDGEKTEYLFGYDAIRLAESSYIDEGFCVFYDIKRWIGDYERMEEITDRQGKRGFVSRKEILRSYFDHVIRAVRNRFKCEIGSVHVSCPVKQKSQFQRLFSEILPEYAVEKKDMIDEGVSVLYNTISGMIEKGAVMDGAEYKALVIDCGGGTTDLCSCRFRIWDQRVAYRIEIDTSYENGDTDFGGNNLTYRIMQLLKIAAVNCLYPGRLLPEGQILSGYDIDVFRFVDQYGTEEVYRVLEEEYGKAEAFLPTQFRKFENQSRSDYYKVKNNFYFLFHLAEVVKKEFYNHVGTLRVVLSSQEVRESATTWIAVDKWKMSGRTRNGLETIKEFPSVYLSIYELELLLKADIYGIIRRFMERMYEEDVLEEYSIIKLTGQSCKIDIFRDALKEFVPGRTIQFKRRSGDLSRDFELKMTCVDGALRYLKDKKYGFADITIRTEEPALPYRVTAFTHSGEEVVLIHRLKRNCPSGMISRNMEDLTLKLYLKDLDGKERYQYTCYCSLQDFKEMEYEEIQKRHAKHIRQADTDDIVEQEVKFFVWARPLEWAFSVVPVYRREGKLYLGKEEAFYFENDGWVQNFFDGMK